MRTLCPNCRKENTIIKQEEHSQRSNHSLSQGKLSIVGLGPGDETLLSPKASLALNEAQIIVGYRGYTRLLGRVAEDREVISYGMTEEIQRARYAIDSALTGKKVCLVSGGDPGIYGMAGVVLGLLKKEEIGRIQIEVIPAISAASSCAGLLGAPLMHDFVTISLSDRLTDRELINKRITLAIRGDFVIVLYNPKSKKRSAPFHDACRILKEYKSPRTPVGIVRKAYREGQQVEIVELQDLPMKKVDMFTTIIIGNSKTYIKDTYMITPRGYSAEV